jgi:hypothetical protein
VTAPLTAERLEERGRALWTWIGAGGSVDRLTRLDRRVRRGARTDWPAPWPGYERRVGVPELDALADAEREAGR